MIVSLIPTAQDPNLTDYTQRTTLGGVEFVLRFYWNDRVGRWHLDISDQEGDPIVVGLVVVIGVPLNRTVTDIRRPRGAILAIDPTGENTDPGKLDLGSRVLLIYVEQ